MFTIYNLTGNLKQNLLYPTIAFVLFTGAFAILINLLPQASIWTGWTLGPAGLFEEFCERNRMGCLIREPANTWSNLAFVYFGFICIALSWTDRSSKNKSNWIIREPVFSLIFGLSFIYVGFGSFFYHASLTRYAQRWDMAGTYALLAFPLVLLLFMHLNKSLTRHIPVGAIVSAILVLDVMLYVFKWQLVGVYVLPVMIGLLVLGFVLLKHRFNIKISKLTALFSALSMILAYTIWQLDFHKILCWPDSFIQGHAIWHLLTGFAAFLLYLMFRTIRGITN